MGFRIGDTNGCFMHSARALASYQTGDYSSSVAAKSSSSVGASVDDLTQKKSRVDAVAGIKKSFFKQASVAGWSVGLLAGSAALAGSIMLDLSLVFPILLFSAGALIYLIFQQLSEREAYQPLPSDELEPTKPARRGGFEATFADR